MTAAFVLIAAALAVSVAAVVVRFARSAGEERLQLKWFAAAAVLVAATLIAGLVANTPVAYVLSNLAFLCLWVAIGIAVLKYRLYDIDLVISKAVLYGSLAVFITAVYAALVVGVGTLAGNARSPLLAALAAAVVAVAFQPARQRAGRLANRVVYGRRATPYQVLADFARRIGGTYAAEDVLPQMAHIVAAGTGAERVVVWLRVDDELRPEASSDGSPPTATLPVTGHELPTLPEADLNVPVVHQGELLGAISVTMPRDEPLRPAGQQLVTDAASQAGLTILQADGNAADAAVATILALCVTEGPPVTQSALCVFGGEVPIMVYNAKRGNVEVLCGQGAAPKLATREHFINRRPDAEPRCEHLLAGFSSGGVQQLE